MNETTTIKIITPLNIVFEGQAKMVTLLGEEGMLGVLPDHAPMIISLKAGLIKIFSDNTHEAEAVYLISSGITEVTANYINVVTETAIDVTTLSEVKIANKLSLL